MRHGFVFSLDAFVAFTLAMLTVSMLIFVIGTPKPYYPSLEQAHQLAHDTLQVLATSSESPSGPTHLQKVLGGQATAKEVMFKVAGGSDAYPGIIPKGFGYKLEIYDFQEESWRAAPLYDAGTDCTFSPKSDRCGKSFTKLQASATTFASIYVDQPRPGASPYCYLRCKGYQPDGSQPETCNNVPCNVSIWNFWPGNNSIQLVRLTVYT